jgi:RNase P subunit RPR2
MIRIVGDDPKHVHEITCKNCAKILEYTKEEIKTRDNGRDISGGPDGCEYIVCHSCHKQVLRAW